MSIKFLPGETPQLISDKFLFFHNKRYFVNADNFFFFSLGDIRTAAEKKYKKACSHTTRRG